MTNTLKEIKFALSNGFTNVKVLTEKDGSTAFIGTFGYIVAATKEEVAAINALIAEYVKVEETTTTFGQELTRLFGKNLVIKNAQIAALLTNAVEKLQVTKKNGTKTYKFEIQGDNESDLALIAEQTAAGKWWVKRSRSKW